MSIGIACFGLKWSMSLNGRTWMVGEFRIFKMPQGNWRTWRDLI